MSSVYNNTAEEIIKAAFRKLGIIAQGEDPTAEMVQDAKGDLNRMIKSWQAQGYHLWTISEGILFTNPNQQKYTLGPGGSNTTLTSGLTSTVLAANAAAAATTITVDSVTGITSGKTIGIILDNSTYHWTTVNGAPSGSVVTLTDALPSAATSGNYVYAYTTRISRPSRIVQARAVIDRTNEIEMTQISDTDYFMMATKSATGVPTQFYYNPVLTNGDIYLWPTSQTAVYSVKFTFESYIDNIDTTVDNPQFPSEWLKAIVWNLAEEIMMDYGTDDSTMTAIALKAAASLDDALAFDQENASVIFQPYPNYSAYLGRYR